MALQSMFGFGSGLNSGLSRNTWQAPQLDQRKTINTPLPSIMGTQTPTASTTPTATASTTSTPTATSGFSGTAPELDWNTFQQYLLNPYLQQGYLNIGDERGQWANQLGLDVGGKPTLQVGDLDWASFNQGQMTGNLDDMGLPAYMTNPNAEADRNAAYQKALADPNTIYTLGADRIGAGGVNTGDGTARTSIQYKKVGDKLVPIAQRDFDKGSLTQDAIKGGLTLAALVAGMSYLPGMEGAALGGAEGLGGAGSIAGDVVGHGAWLGEGAASGVGAWDAALANAGLGEAAAGAGGAIAGSGFQAPAAGSTSGAGLNLSGAAPGSVYGTGSGLGIAPEAIGAATGGTGLGAMIGSTIPAGSALAGLGAGSGLAGSLLGQVGKTVGGNVAGNIIDKVLGGSSGGVSNLGNLASLFTNYKQYDNMKGLIDEIKSIYKPDGVYAKNLESELARRDAAAGRNSQYGPRLMELNAKLGDSQARALSGLGGLFKTQQGGLNGMVGAGSRLLDGTGLGDLLSQGLKDLFNSQGGMHVGELGTTPSIWDRPAEDIDLEELWGG